MKVHKRHNKIVIAWTFIWLISFAILVGGPNELWDNNTITIIAAIINFILIITMLYVSKNQFDDYDELQKTVQLKAVSLTLFLTVFMGVFSMGIYEAGLVEIEPRVHHLVMFAALTFIVSSIFIFKKYQ
tara:strand:+ start:339 stop:725 length:387 start_codon:yes stop_codon:yes gene_type:complete